MIAKRCPKCGSKWYSAYTVNDWVCEKCGEILTSKEEVPVEEEE